MSPHRRLLSVISSATGAVLILVGIPLVQADHGTTDFGSVAVSAVLSVSDSARQPAFVTAVSSGMTETASPEPTSEPAPAAAAPTVADQHPHPPPGIPTSLQLSSLGVTADVVEVVTENGELQVPSDPATVGWWIGSALAGAHQGTTVIDGHVDSAALGAGAFFQLADLSAGDFVTVTTDTGDTVRYQVDARRTYRKTDGLPAELFDGSGPHRLVLITCGGSFDNATLSYDDNVVVIAGALPD